MNAHRRLVRAAQSNKIGYMTAPSESSIVQISQMFDDREYQVLIDSGHVVRVAYRSARKMARNGRRGSAGFWQSLPIDGARARAIVALATAKVVPLSLEASRTADPKK